TGGRTEGTDRFCNQRAPAPQAEGPDRCAAAGGLAGLSRGYRSSQHIEIRMPKRQGGLFADGIGGEIFRGGDQPRGLEAAALCWNGIGRRPARSKLFMMC